MEVFKRIKDRTTGVTKQNIISFINSPMISDVKGV